LASNGILYNHDTTSLELSSVNLATGALGANVFTTAALTDLAATSCQNIRTTAAPASSSSLSNGVLTIAPTGVTSVTSPVVTTVTSPPTTGPYVPTFPCDSSTNVRLFAAVSGSGRIVQIAFNGSWSLSTVTTVTSPVLISVGSPNGLAVQPGSNRLYLASFGGNPPYNLFYVNLANPTVAISAGQLTGNPGSGTFFGGYFWYIAQRSDVLRRVTLDPSTGAVVTDTVFARVTNGVKAFDLGDVEFGANGLLYFSGKVMSSTLSTALTVAREISSFDIVTNTYNMIANTTATGKYNQIARGFNGVLYNHDTTSLELSPVDLSTGALGTSVFTTPALTDLASDTCFYLDLNGRSVSDVTGGTVTYSLSSGEPSDITPAAEIIGGSVGDLVSSFSAKLDGTSISSSEFVGASFFTGLSFVYDTATNTLSSTSPASLAVYQDVIRSLSYFNDAESVASAAVRCTVRLTLASGVVLESWVAIAVVA